MYSTADAQSFHQMFGMLPPVNELVLCHIRKEEDVGGNANVSRSD